MAIRIECQNGYYGQTYTTPKTLEFVERGKDFEIIGISKDTDTGEVFYTVECTNLGDVTQFVIPKSEALDKKKVLSYALDGLDVTSSTASIIPEVFIIKEDEYIEAKKPIGEVHSIAGVKEIITNGVRSFIFGSNINPITQSKYVGHLNLEPKGNKEDWFKFVRNELTNSTEMQFIIAFAFSAILHGVLQDMTDVDNFIVHIRGDSSSGKTTALCLAASVFGAGVENDPRGIISTWNATKNAILRRLMSVNGMLMGLDEVSMNRDKDFTGLIYSISSGVEKDRLTRDAKVQERLTGRYLLMSTGEASLLAKTNGNIGLTLRVLEFDNHKWTKSAEQAERIKCFCKKNYGHGATEFGLHVYQLILDKGIEYVHDNFEYWRRFYCKRCKIQARKERVSGRYALILLGAQYANRFFDMKMDIPALCDFIIKNENASSDDRDSYNEVYNRLIAYIVMNQKYFDREKKEGSRVEGGMRTVVPNHLEQIKSIEPWGEIKYLPHGKQLSTGEFSDKTVAMTLVAFDRIVGKELGYEDPKAIRAFLKSKELSRCEGDRTYIRKTFHGVRTDMVEIFMPSDEIQNTEEQKLAAKEIIKKCFKELDAMYELSYAERNKVFRQLESLKELMTKSQKEEYESLLKDREMLSKAKLLLEEDD